MLSENINNVHYCCTVCNKQYSRKSSLEKHKILCEFKTKSKREQQVDFEELGDTPTHYQLVKIVQELTLKMIKIEEKMTEMQKWVDKKKRKIKDRNNWEVNLSGKKVYFKFVVSFHLKRSLLIFFMTELHP